MTAAVAAARGTIRDIIAAELGRNTPPAADSLADALRGRHGDGIAGLILYGSCLRSGDEQGVFDFYLLVDSYRAFYGNWLLAAANALLPPNVFYLVADSKEGTARAKVAVMSRRQFVRAMRRTSLHASFWARFCQPVALVHARDTAVIAEIRDALVDATITAAYWAARLGPACATPGLLWRRLFRATYAAEVRAEAADRSDAIYQADAARYDALTEPALIAAGLFIAWDADRRSLSIMLPEAEGRRARCTWRMHRATGRVFALLRLSKAAFTFEGGVDYICWKIERHSGVVLGLSDWQRRHPLLAGPIVAWRLYRQGLFR